MGIKNASVSPRKTSIILLQIYALNNVCFIYFFPFYIDMYLFKIYIFICTFANIAIVVLLCLYYLLLYENNGISFFFSKFSYKYYISLFAYSYNDVINTH